jgi:copper chaperone CopZ
MHCGSCVRRVSQALTSTEGVTVNEVRLGAARVTADGGAGSGTGTGSGTGPIDAAIAALAKAGYKAYLES